ncbi:hypothetical protein RIF29_24621 [Crotalaria pallida]|uniref:X8 domain-containing protein n=1 Tax=Crotalaria pallida TaxID=3830 RepID=A0AAN9HYM1_CROPI
MATEASISLLFLSFLIICCSGTAVGFSYGTAASSTSAMTTFIKKNKISSQTQTQFLCFFCSKSSILSQSKVHMRRVLDDTTTYNSPTTVVSPTNPASSTAPIITPPDSPSIISVPSTNQGSVPITVPSTTTPLTPIPLTPSNPANSPIPVTNPVTSPITVPATNPVTFSYPPPPSGTTLLPPASGNTNTPPAAATTPGQSWCVAKTGVPQPTLQSALDYACGMDSTVCSQIQQGGSCYNPNSLQNHASVAFNSYYQKNPAPTSCDFGGAATLVNTNPSSGTCIYSSSSASPLGAGTFGSGSGLQSPPPGGDADTSHSARLRPFIGCMALLVSLVTGRLGMR